jgi:methionyl-tRNA formyltransferase
MRIVFMGTPEFAASSLNRLYEENYDVVAVFSQPDKARNRGMKKSSSPVKELAIKHGTPVFQPETLRDGNAYSTLKDLRCDIIVVVAYGKLLPKEILDLPPLGCINIHASLLPKYRGAAPIQWAVLNGEHETGVTSMYMSEKMDEGDMILSEKTNIGENETAGELFVRLGDLGSELLSETIQAIQNNTAPRTPQNHSEATYAPFIDRTLSPIDWTKTAREIKQKVLGLHPWPTATAEWGGVIYKIHSVDICEDTTSCKPGEIGTMIESKLEIVCQNGTVMINEIQAPGAKRMKISDFLKGNTICQ